jgi:thioester reductase-like protein
VRQLASYVMGQNSLDARNVMFVLRVADLSALSGDKNVHYIESITVGTGSRDRNDVTETSHVNCQVCRCNSVYSVHVYRLLFGFLQLKCS